MNLMIHILSAELAAPLQPFILPEVWEAEEREHFVYFAAVDEDKLVGAAVIAPLQKGAELRSIAVSPDYTGQGIAGILLKEAKRMLARLKIDTLWAEYVLPAEAWAEVDGLLQENGFALIDEDPVYLVPVAELMKSPLIEGTPPQKHVISLAEANDLDMHHLYYAMQEKMKIDLSVLQDCDPNHSFIWKQADAVTAAIFMGHLQGDKADILWMWLDAQSHNPKALMGVIAAVVRQCAADHPAETKLQATCLVENSTQILQHLVSGLEEGLQVRTYLASTVMEG